MPPSATGHLRSRSPSHLSEREDREGSRFAWLERNGLVVATVALYAAFVAVTLPADLVQSTWFALVGGREIVQHGLPQHDALFVWTHGRHWVDQPWLGQLLLYGLYAAGGIRLLLAAHFALLVSTAAILVSVARARGGSPRAILLAGLVCLLVAPWGLQTRAQTLGELLFAVWLALVLTPGRLSPRRVAALLLVLVVWANVHGSVALVVALTVARWMSLLIFGHESERKPALALVLCPPLCLFASPYGTSLVGYYHSLLLNPNFPKYLGEWKHPLPGPLTAVFYAALVGSAWLLWRQRRRISVPDALLLVIVAVSALQAYRSVIWFGLVGVAILPPLLDGALGKTTFLTGRASSRWGMASAGLAAVVCLSVFSHSDNWFLSHWPAPAATRAAAYVAGHPSAEVVANVRDADWLLLMEPSLRGRIAYDTRFELLTSSQFPAMAKLDKYGPAPSRLPKLLMFNPRSQVCKSTGRCRILYRSADIAVAGMGGP